MRAFLRITIMVVISIVVLTICFGGLSGWHSFEVIGGLLAVFWGIPLFILFAICHLIYKAMRRPSADS
ncbi:hypothetical protein [Bradyrhizobium sp. SK17]|uniref:hypothetical protein n=1 Tax=Bradyrhizobium sp. SK17 TaxID=2057741 RepID=UPI000C30AC94|nr:hypothetical protein [Bradyrhizobium sp. SK17]AUC99166.1 hypothetical protein CWS35_36675 [Bradyrhizobium sp. SK17]